MSKQHGIQPDLHIPSYQQKLVFLSRHLLWNHWEALNKDRQGTVKHSCSSQVQPSAQNLISEYPLLALLFVLQNILLTLRKKELPSPSCWEEPLSRALHPGTTSAEGLGQQKARGNAPQLGKHSSLLSLNGKTRTGFPMSLPHRMPGPWWRHMSHKCSCEQEQGSNFLCSQVWHGYKWNRPLNYTGSITQLHSAMDSRKQSQSFP